MNHDYADPEFSQRNWYPDAYPFGSNTDWYGSPVDDLHSGVPLEPPDLGWDPVEELAILLQDAMPAERSTIVPPPRSEQSAGVDLTDPSEDPAQTTVPLPPVRRSSAGHRKVRVRKPRRNWLRTGSFAIVALIAAIVAVVSAIGGMASYAPLQGVTSGTKGGGMPWWPLLVYGPWIVASLSILRTALHRRRAFHSWFVVLLFSAVAMVLCVTQAERNFTGIAAAALPAIASLACFQQLVRQITLSLPPRQSKSRHRN
ncbi:DUF2637 domain-containing protein [Streptomyces sp. NPDC002328]|uniref:DUF2637 domain-containing protein n=1 Tax=Streptomyces sp. NPDC002328 TaxID=3364642 RepID=UPI0036C50ED4